MGAISSAGPPRRAEARLQRGGLERYIMWIVYIIYSNSGGKTYIGSTDNFKRRIIQHNKGEVRATRLNKPWTPIYLEFYPEEKAARAREQELKTAPGRRYLKKVVNNIINKWAYSSVG